MSAAGTVILEAVELPEATCSHGRFVVAEFSLTSSAFVPGRAVRALHPLARLGHPLGRRWACRRAGGSVGGAQRLRHGRLSRAMPAARARTPPLPLPAPCRGPGPAACAWRWRGGAGAGPRGQGPCGRGARRDLRTLTVRIAVVVR